MTRGAHDAKRQRESIQAGHSTVARARPELLVDHNDWNYYRARADRKLIVPSHIAVDRHGELGR